MGIKRSWTDEELKIAVETNISFLGILRKLGLSRSPGNYKLIHIHINRLKLDISHIKGQAHGTTFANKRPLSEILVQNSDYSSTSHLRKRLIKEGLLKNKCISCGLEDIWNGNNITLQLDHINGDCYDNRIENLRILCPNCHSQTKTFTSNNIRGRYKKEQKKCICGKEIHKTSEQCAACHKRNTSGKIIWPQLDTLIELVIKTNYTSVAKSLGVSDNAIRGYIKRRLGYAPKKHKYKISKQD
jgi:hypothetical protein